MADAPRSWAEYMQAAWADRSPAAVMQQAGAPAASFITSGNWAGAIDALSRAGSGPQWGGVTDPNSNAFHLLLRPGQIANRTWTPSDIASYWQALKPHYDKLAALDARTFWSGQGKTSDGQWVVAPDSSYFAPDDGAGWISEAEWDDAMRRNILAGGAPDLAKYATWASRDAPSSIEKWGNAITNVAGNYVTGGLWGLGQSAMEAGMGDGDWGDVGVQAASMFLVPKLLEPVKDVVQPAFNAALGSNLGSVATGATLGATGSLVTGRDVGQGALGGALRGAWNGTSWGDSTRDWVNNTLGTTLGDVANDTIFGALRGALPGGPTAAQGALAGGLSSAVSAGIGRPTPAPPGAVPTSPTDNLEEITVTASRLPGADMYDWTTDTDLLASIGLSPRDFTTPVPQEGVSAWLDAILSDGAGGAETLPEIIVTGGRPPGEGPPSWWTENDWTTPGWWDQPPDITTPPVTLPGPAPDSSRPGLPSNLAGWLRLLGSLGLTAQQIMAIVEGRREAGDARDNLQQQQDMLIRSQMGQLAFADKALGLADQQLAREREAYDYTVGQNQKDRDLALDQRGYERGITAENAAQAQREFDLNLGRLDRYDSALAGERNRQLGERAAIGSQIDQFGTRIRGELDRMGTYAGQDWLTRADLDEIVSQREAAYLSDVDRTAQMVASQNEAGLMRGGLDRTDPGASRAAITSRLSADRNMARTRAADSALQYFTGANQGLSVADQGVRAGRTQALEEVTSAYGRPIGFSLQNSGPIALGVSSGPIASRTPTTPARTDGITQWRTPNPGTTAGSLYTAAGSSFGTVANQAGYMIPRYAENVSGSGSSAGAAWRDLMESLPDLFGSFKKGGG